MDLRTCVSPSGKFVYGIHKPGFRVENLRERDFISELGLLTDGSPVDNQCNFPEGPVHEPNGEWIFEIPNAFPFMGTTFIARGWADGKAADPSAIRLPEPPQVSFSSLLKEWFGEEKIPLEKINRIFESLPEPLLLALAQTSTDPFDLVRMAELSCEFIHGSGGRPIGLKYDTDSTGRVSAVIRNELLFDVIANNYSLPDEYKEVMVMRPGAQGGSEIVGEWRDKGNKSHVFEYLRRNSYIPWGHYAANMASDAIRYRLSDLTMADMTGLRHLYYQRIYVGMAGQQGLAVPATRRPLTSTELEELRNRVYEGITLATGEGRLRFNSTLWGWNFGFDIAPSRYRLHASHQQIHQQFALIPASVPAFGSDGRVEGAGREMDTYGCGDQVAAFAMEYRKQTGQPFFDDYIRAIRSNRRMDSDREKESSLIVYEDDGVMVFVPKAQTSQWELQLMTTDPVGNIIEADSSLRFALDRAMFISLRVLGAMGAKMVTSIECSKRFDSPDSDHRLLYSFMPKLPYSPGAFSEAQLRWINGHYPEDFAAACRAKVAYMSGVL
ncbi:MAG: hypothetical protein KAR13_13005 [Desulfobulbaceae bacterium]|nr:hypothetical protein [Desulfobulbaceae bacterium]